MEKSPWLRWAGWLVFASVASMILSVAFLNIAVSKGTLVPGTHTHSVLVETLDTLVTGFLIPVPFAFHSIYRTNEPRVSLIAMLLGAGMLIGMTILNFLFVLEVMWFSDSLAYYALGGIAFSLWLILSAYLANRSGKPTRGTLLNLLGASIIAMPIWAVWLGYLLVSGRLAHESR